jgi:cytochrome c
MKQTTSRVRYPMDRGILREVEMHIVTTRTPTLALVVATLWFVACGVHFAQATPDGQLAFNNNCRTCHSTDKGDNRLGPNLHAIIGRKSGAADGYAYSSALKRLEFEWTRENLDQFIEDPDSVVPGNEMKPYSGIDDQAIRQAIVDHLSKMSEKSAALD